MGNIARISFVGIQGTENLPDVHLEPGSHVIGRSDGNDVVIKKNDISRQHARVTVEATRLVVEDLGSANGTRVNGHRITEAVIVSDGDEVEFGDRKYRCQVELAEEAPAAPEPPPPPPPEPTPEDVPATEMTAVWTPPEEIKEALDSPAEATMAYEPPSIGLTDSVDVSPVTSTTSDVDVLDADEAAPSGSKGSGRLKSIVYGLTFLILAAVLLIGALLFWQAWQNENAPGPVAEWQYKAPPELATKKDDLAALSRADLLRYEQGVYLYDQKKYTAARTVFTKLARTYAGNETIEKMKTHVDELISDQIDRLLREGSDSVDFLKYPEARAKFEAVLRIATVDDPRRQAAQTHLDEIKKNLEERR